MRTGTYEYNTKFESNKFIYKIYRSVDELFGSTNKKNTNSNCSHQIFCNIEKNIK